MNRPAMYVETQFRRSLKRARGWRVSWTILGGLVYEPTPQPWYMDTGLSLPDSAAYLTGLGE